MSSLREYNLLISSVYRKGKYSEWQCAGNMSGSRPISVRKFRFRLGRSRVRYVLTDTDECHAEACDDATSTCVNTPGSYHCQCHNGFEPDPLTSNQCRGHAYLL